MKDATLIRIGAMTMRDLVLESVLTCPKCAFASAESMSTDACQFFYECKGCGAVLKPQSRRLLRVLFLWLREMSPHSGEALLL
jgi:hypothetical protein